MKILQVFTLAAIAFIGLVGSVNAESVLLAPDDFVGITFWVVSLACLAATAFFFIERGSVPAGWKVSITVAGLVTGIAFINYLYMRQVWVITGDLPTVYRYIDWFITAPLLMIEFYFVLSAARKVPDRVFWRLLIGSVVMLSGGYLGESGHINGMLGFIIFMTGWLYILYEVFSGDAGKIAAKIGNKPLVTAYNAMRMIVTIGWAVYPLGYIFGYLTDTVDANSLNVIYNAADLLNKIAFGLIICAAAMQQSLKAR